MYDGPVIMGMIMCMIMCMTALCACGYLLNVSSVAEAKRKHFLYTCVIHAWNGGQLCMPFHALAHLMQECESV
jgi:hypothetical protein